MATSNQLVVFTVDDQQYALKLSSVERIVRAVEVTHLPDSPDIVLGVIDVEGRVIPVVNTRRRLGLPERELELQDLFLIVTEAGRTVALVGDDVKPVVEISDREVVGTDRMLQGTGYVGGVAKLNDDMAIVLDVEKILSYDQRGSLERALQGLSD